MLVLHNFQLKRYKSFNNFQLPLYEFRPMCARTMCFSCAASFVIADFSQFAFSASHFFLCVLFSFFVIFQLCPIYSCNFATYDAHSFFFANKNKFSFHACRGPSTGGPGQSVTIPSTTMSLIEVGSGDFVKANIANIIFL